MKVGAGILLFCLIGFTGFAQTESGSTPFVTGIAAAVAGNSVQLTWQDPKSAVDTLLVYRSTSEITADNLTGA